MNENTLKIKSLEEYLNLIDDNPSPDEIESGNHSH